MIEDIINQFEINLNLSLLRDNEWHHKRFQLALKAVSFTFYLLLLVFFNFPDGYFHPLYIFLKNVLKKILILWLYLTLSVILYHSL